MERIPEFLRIILCLLLYAFLTWYFVERDPVPTWMPDWIIFPLAFVWLGVYFYVIAPWLFKLDFSPF